MAKNLALSLRKWKKTNLIGENGGERKINPSANPGRSKVLQNAPKGEHFAILLTFIKLPVGIKAFDLSFFKWPFYTGFTVLPNSKERNLFSIIG